MLRCQEIFVAALRLDASRLRAARLASAARHAFSFSVRQRAALVARHAVVRTPRTVRRHTRGALRAAFCCLCARTQRFCLPPPLSMLNITAC